MRGPQNIKAAHTLRGSWTLRAVLCCSTAGEDPAEEQEPWAGALQDRWARSPILAAARGSLELISTGALISMECLWLVACEDLCVTLSAVKEWRFLAFFLPSTRR